MAEYEEEGKVVAAAKILLSLRCTEVKWWPEWFPPPEEERASAVELRRPAVEEAERELPPVPMGWPKRPRSLRRVQAKRTAWSLSFEGLLARMQRGGSTGSGACSSGEAGTRWPSRVRVIPEKVEPIAARRPEVPPCHGAAAGSGPSTSGVDRARSQPRPRAGEKAQVKVAARKEATMSALSPETPLDYGAAAGSGASSSGDEGAPSPAKRKAPGASRSGGASSGDEGCSSPAKRTRADDAAAGQAAAAAVNVEEPKIQENYRDEKGHLLFDLNDDINISWLGEDFAN